MKNVSIRELSHEKKNNDFLLGCSALYGILPGGRITKQRKSSEYHPDVLFWKERFSESTDAAIEGLQTHAMAPVHSKQCPAG
jgi:hypothetical protein